MSQVKPDHSVQEHAEQEKAHIKENCRIPSLRLRAYETCPFCQTEKLDYNGLLQLFCPQCGVMETGVFT